MRRRVTRASKALPRRTSFAYLKDAAGRHAPIVYLQVWTRNRWLYLQAYVDSGAAWTIFHADVAQLLGIKLSKLKRRYMALGNGSVLPVFLARVRVRSLNDITNRSKNPARPSRLKPTLSASENPTGTVNSAPANRTRTRARNTGSTLPLPSAI